MTALSSPVLRQRPVLPAALLFLGLWGFHLFSAGGTLVPYRDTGEMTSAAATLGVAHPPGYPLYILAGKLADALGLGNGAYRLNLLSALAAAVGGLVLFRLAGGGMAGAGAAALWAACPFFWELASVSEMYTLGLLGAAGLLLCARGWAGAETPSARARPVLFAAYLLGLTLGARTDAVLLAPAFALLLWKRPVPPRVFLAAVAFGLAGFSVFLFLPLRSGRDPLVDWGNPETLSVFMDVLLRKSHGGTLDLLSKSYAPGENFAAEAALFARAGAGAFTWAGLPLALLGGWAQARRAPLFFSVLAVSFLVTGPLFLYLANMPPNPYAVAIVEAHYALPLLVAAVWVGEGVGRLAGAMPQRAASRRATAAAAVVLAALFFLQTRSHAARGVKRWNMTARDYVTNLLRSASPGSVGVSREDVQLFGLWDRALVAKARPDVAVVSQGLAQSPWYADMLRRQGHGLALAGLKDAAGWDVLRQNRRPLWMTSDVTLPPGLEAPAAPFGLAAYFADPPSSPAPLTDLYVVRGPRVQTRAPDFFTEHLLADYAKAALRSASTALRDGDGGRAEALLALAARFDPDLPAAPFHLGYARLQRNDLPRADAAYARAARLYDEMLRRAARYKSLPDVVQSLRTEAAEAWTHRGVVAEKQNNIENARRSYARALELNPASARAHFNWAVTYWNRDWPQAVAHLESAARLEPENASYRDTLERARRLGRS